tara:strand:+ start:71 stop:490 length:420 start_codon:yes stop_codon:yes gene_type:complete
MPTFKEDADAFRKGPSGFKMKYKKSSFPFKGDGRAESSAFQANEYQGGIMPQTYGTVPSPSKKRANSPMKNYEIDVKGSAMKKKKTSPHETVKKLQAKKSAGTITPSELKELNKLMKNMDKFYKDQSAPSYRGNYDEID